MKTLEDMIMRKKVYLDREDFIKKASEKAIDMFGEIGLKALYYVSNEDVTPFSDIDLFGIVAPDFDINKNEKVINKHYEDVRKTDYADLEVRFRGIGLDELDGGNIRSVLGKYVGARELLKEFPFYRSVWGEDFDFSKFKLKPLTPAEEVNKIGDKIVNYLDGLEKGKEAYPIQNFSKDVLRLVRVEAVGEHGYKFHPSYKRLAKHFGNNRDHIVHDMMKLRHKNVSKGDVLKLENKISNYVSRLQKDYAA